jgi:hypothetical protein
MNVYHGVPWFLTKSHGGPCGYRRTFVGIVGRHVVVVHSVPWSWPQPRVGFRETSRDLGSVLPIRRASLVISHQPRDLSSRS